MILLADSRTVTADFCAQFDALIVDPPYSEHVHANATSQSAGRGARKRDLGFDHLSRDLRNAVALAAANVKRWSVVYSDVESSHLMRRAAEVRGATYIRTVPWVRWSMPQLSGDRPAQGFEHVLLFWGHQEGQKKSWNGSGALTHLADDDLVPVAFGHLALRGEDKHKAEKPLDKCLDLVSWFSNEGETVLDLCAGVGSVGRACDLLGRGYLGFEIDPNTHRKATERLGGSLSPGERARVERWLEQKLQVSEPSGKAAERAERRQADRERVRKKAGL